MNRLFGFLVGMRKFTAMMIFMAIMVIFRIHDLINGEQFAQNVQIALVAFFGTNIGEHLINLGKDWVTGKLKEITDAEAAEKSGKSSKKSD